MRKNLTLDQCLGRKKKEDNRGAMFLFAMQTGLPVHLAGLFSMGVLYSRGKRIRKDLNEEIRKYVKKQLRAKVKTGVEITSAQELPEKIGDYNVTGEIRNDIDRFIGKERRNHYLVYTNDPYRVFVIRVNNKGTKVIKAKNILSAADQACETFYGNITRATSLIDVVSSGLEREVNIHEGKIPKDEKTKFSSNLSQADRLLIGAEKALKKIGKITSFYKPKSCDVVKSLDNLSTLRALQNAVKERVDSTEIFAPYFHVYESGRYHRPVRRF